MVKYICRQMLTVVKALRCFPQFEGVAVVLFVQALEYNLVYPIHPIRV